jgi:hypothetical protein
MNQLKYRVRTYPLSLLIALFSLALKISYLRNWTSPENSQRARRNEDFCGHAPAFLKERKKSLLELE